MKIISGILFLALMGAGLARAEDEPPAAPPLLPLHVGQCALPNCIMVQAPQVAALALAYDDAVARMADLERQLRELQKAKGCAKLEVTEPPRFVPKKQHDS